jgi:hypothetical protein
LRNRPTMPHMRGDLPWPREAPTLARSLQRVN